MNILDDIRSGDINRRDQAYKALYQNPKIRNSIEAYVSSIGIRSLEYKDVLQDALIKLDEKIRKKEFMEKSSIETFLIGIAKWMIRDLYKKEKKYQLLEINSNSSEEKKVFQFDQFREIEIEDWEKDRNAALRELIAQMDDKCRKAISMFYFEESSMKEIANSRGLRNASQAKKAVFRCRKKLRAAIQSQPVLLKILMRKS